MGPQGSTFNNFFCLRLPSCLWASHVVSGSLSFLLPTPLLTMVKLSGAAESWYSLKNIKYLDGGDTWLGLGKWSGFRGQSERSTVTGVGLWEEWTLLPCVVKGCLKSTPVRNTACGRGLVSWPVKYQLPRLTSRHLAKHAFQPASEW